MDDRVTQLEARLSAISERIQWLADTEARVAWVRGFGARGEFLDEKERLLDRAEEIVSEMEQLNSSSK